MKLTNKKINTHLQIIHKAEKMLKKVIESVQDDCKHENIAECDYHPSEYGYSSLPLRVCLDCGVSEEGWGCGFRVLVEKQKGLSPRQISRDDLYSVRCGKFIQQ
jgi:hypothetical protein